MSSCFTKVFFNLYFFLSLWLTAAAGLEPNYTVKIPMRDGFELSTDIYLPENKSEPHPCLLIRCPAGRKAEPWIAYSAFSQLGYVVAIQDTRSAVDHEGKIFPYFHDGWGKHQDGYDTVEWLSTTPWTNGKIGTVGESAAGITQLFMAPSAPPSLVCQYIGCAAGNIYAHGIYPGGRILKNQVEGWLSLHAKDKGVLNHVWNNPLYNEFWENFDTIRVSHQTKVPALLYTGWYDTFLQGTLDAYIARQSEGGEGARGKQKLWIGPWTHYWPLITSLGDFQVPVEGRAPPHDLSPQRWFDFYLKGKKNGVEDLPTVTYYVMGPFDGSPSSGNVWRTSDKWPVPARETPFYLTSNKKLAKTAPEEESAFSFFHDPADPVPTLGGRNLFMESGPKDQRAIENRQDVLVFSTDPMEQDLEITGPIHVKLSFASDCDDADVSVRLTDVYPDGRSILISDGICRTGHFKTADNEKTSGIPREAAVDLWSTSIVIPKGHSLRIIVSGSNYPRYEINKSTGPTANKEGRTVARNVVYTGGTSRSRLILPVVREGDAWLVKKP